jgi:AraC-like DNA-binding protein
VDLLGVRFRPGRAATFLGVPATDLTGEIAGLDAFWSDAGSLRDELALLRPSALREGGGEGVRPVASRAERRLLAERAAVLDRVLLARIGSREPDGLVAGALQLIRESQGCMRVREIERRLGTSERTLGRRFGAAVGLSPKESSRIARFLMVARRLDREPQTGLARLAFGAGYADQSHFTRDFADLAGITPAAYAREPSVTRGLAG